MLDCCKGRVYIAMLFVAHMLLHMADELPSIPFFVHGLLARPPGLQSHTERLAMLEMFDLHS